MSIRISNQEGGIFAAQQDPIQITEDQNQLIFISPSDTLSSLVNSLNQIGASPKDLVSIIQALKESGALIAELDII